MTDNIEKMLNAPDDEVRREAALFLREHISSVDPDKAIKMLVQALKDPSWRVRKTAADILVEAYPPESFFDYIVPLLYDPDNAGARNSAIEVFVKVGPASSVKLSEAFETDDVDVRKFIIDIAGEIAHRSMIPLLVLALKDDDENVKASAVEHLGTLKEPLVVDSLISILSENDLWTSYPAIEALGRIGDIKALPYLIEALTDRFLREPALRALGSIDGDVVVKHIVPYLADRSRAVRQVAFSALEVVYEKGVSGDYIRAEIERCHGDDAHRLIHEAAASDNNDLKMSSLMLMGVMGEVSAIEPLLKAASEGVNEDLIVRSLMHIGKRAPQELLKRIDHLSDDPIVMRTLVSSIAAMALPEFRDTLSRMLSDPDGHVRARAAEGLGSLGDPGAIPDLLEAVYDEYRDVIVSVVGALVKLKAGTRTEVLQRLSRDSSPEIRSLSVPLLADADRDEALKTVSLLLTDPSAIVRRAAVDYFDGRIDGSNDSMLLRGLTDESPDVRSAIAIRLGETRNPKYLGPLVTLLSDDVDMVRVSGCKALGLLGEHGALDPLARLLCDRNGFVVTSSIEAISRIGGKDALNMIAGMLTNPDNEIRRTAIRSLSRFQAAKSRILPYLESDDWATRYEAVKALAPYIHDSAVHDSIRKAYRSETDNVVRDAFRESLDA